MADHSDFIRTLYAAFGRGDLQAILDASTADIAWSSNGDPAVIPWAGNRAGRDGVRGFFDALLGHLDFEAFEPRRFLPSGDTVVVLGRTRARSKTGGRGVFDCDWVHVFTVNAGRLAGFQEFYDTLAIQRALTA